MQFQVLKSTFLKALSNVNGAVEKKNTIPVLQNVKIEAASSKVILTATDLDITVNCVFEVDSETAGITTVSAQMLYEIIRKIPDGSMVKLVQENPNILQIVAGKSKYSLPCINAAEFPAISEADFVEILEIDAEKMAEIIDKTKFAISNDETRYYLNGIYLHSYKKDSVSEIRSVATDGHKLALAFYPVENLNNDFAVILPKKSVNEIRRIIEGSKKIKFFTSRGKVKITSDNFTIITKLIDGQFPDYEKIIPKNNEQIAKINRKKLFDSVDRVSIVAQDKHRLVKLILENNSINMQINSTDGSFAFEELEIDYPNQRIETGFNSRYLLEIIGNVNKDELVMKLNDGKSPAIIEANDLNALFVIMPVKI